MRKKKRWSQLRRQATPNVDRFRYVGTGDGRIEFFRHWNRFSWGPLDVDRQVAAGLVRRLNELRGGDINTVGKRLTDQFKAEYDAGQHRPKGGL